MSNIYCQEPKSNKRSINKSPNTSLNPQNLKIDKFSKFKHGIQGVFNNNKY